MNALNAFVKTHADIVRFGIVGGVSTVLDVALLNILTRMGVDLFWAVFFGCLLGAANGYFMNNQWTYSRLNRQNSMADFIKYAAISFIGLGLTEAIVFALHKEIGTGLNTGKLVAVVIVFIWNYYANRHFTFKPHLVVDAKA